MQSLTFIKIGTSAGGARYGATNGSNLPARSPRRDAIEIYSCYAFPSASAIRLARNFSESFGHKSARRDRSAGMNGVWCKPECKPTCATWPNWFASQDLTVFEGRICKP